MYGLMLQDWTTIEGPASGTLSQTEAFWLDTSPYLDVITFLQVSSVFNAVLAYQTAPTKDESLFQNMDSFAMAAGVTVGVYLRDTAAYPISHWLRWQLNGGGSAFNVTFRIWVAANQPGGLAAMSARHGEGYADGQGGPAWVPGGYATDTSVSKPPNYDSPTPRGIKRWQRPAPYSDSGHTGIKERQPFPTTGDNRTGIKMLRARDWRHWTTRDYSRLPEKITTVAPGAAVSKKP